MTALVVGMGNPVLSDDAVGVRLARDLSERLRRLPGVEVMEECSVGGLELIDVLRGYRRAVVLDAIRTRGGVPGAWYHFRADALAETAHLTNVHDANFATALELGRRLGVPLPEAAAIDVFAVEILDDVSFSERMTAPLEAAYPRLCAEIRREVERLVVGEARGLDGGRDSSRRP